MLISMAIFTGWQTMRWNSKFQLIQMFYKCDIKHLDIQRLGGIPGEKSIWSKCTCQSHLKRNKTICRGILLLLLLNEIYSIICLSKTEVIKV